MTADSQNAVQAAIVAALRAAAGVTSQLAEGAEGVRDHVPQASAFPYLVVGETTARPFDFKDEGGKTEGGMDQQVTIHTWSRQRGLQETKAIMAAVVAALDRQSLTVSGHDLVDIRFVFSQSLLDTDGLTRHGVQRFQVLTQAI